MPSLSLSVSFCALCPGLQHPAAIYCLCMHDLSSVVRGTKAVCVMLQVWSLIQTTIVFRLKLLVVCKTTQSVKGQSTILQPNLRKHNVFLSHDFTFDVPEHANACSSSFHTFAAHPLQSCDTVQSSYRHAFAIVKDDS